MLERTQTIRYRCNQPGEIPSTTKKDIDGTRLPPIFGRNTFFQPGGGYDLQISAESLSHGKVSVIWSD